MPISIFWRLSVRCLIGWALLQKLDGGRTRPFPGRAQATRLISAWPSALKLLMTKRQAPQVHPKPDPTDAGAEHLEFHAREKLAALMEREDRALVEPLARETMARNWSGCSMSAPNLWKESGCRW